MSKPQSTAKLFSMPEEQQAKLAHWMLSGTPYWQCQELVKKEFGVEVKSPDSFSQFWQKVCEPALLAKRRRVAGMATSIAEEAQRNPAQFDAATIDAIKQKAFELAMSPGADPKEVHALFSLILKAKDQDADKEKLKLVTRQLELAEQKYRDHVAERKAAIDKELAAATNSGGLSAETLEKIQKELRLL